MSVYQRERLRNVNFDKQKQVCTRAVIQNRLTKTPKQKGGKNNGKAREK
jgi:hypothetical protein